MELELDHRLEVPIFVVECYGAEKGGAGSSTYSSTHDEARTAALIRASSACVRAQQVVLRFVVETRGQALYL